VRDDAALAARFSHRGQFPMVVHIDSTPRGIRQVDRPREEPEVTGVIGEPSKEGQDGRLVDASDGPDVNRGPIAKDDVGLSVRRVRAHPR